MSIENYTNKTNNESSIKQLRGINMQNKLAISIRSFIVQIFSFVIIASFALYFLYQAVKLRSLNLLIIHLIIDAMMIVILLIYVCFIIDPYIKINKQYSLFINGTIFEDFFKEKANLIPQTPAFYVRLQQLINKQDAISLSKKQAEYLALQNQINPHFLYNTLEAIRSDAYRAGLEDIAKSAEALASFFRYTITEVNTLVTLGSELNNVENYFFIQQYRFGKKIKMEVSYSDPNDLLLLMPKLTLQPIFENAIIHGLEGKAEGGTVRIEIESSETNLFITIIDDGLGMSPEVLQNISRSLEQVGISYVKSSSSSGSGIAFINVSRRIKLLFGDDYGIHVFSTPKIGTSVHITLPRADDNFIAAVQV